MLHQNISDFPKASQVLRDKNGSPLRLLVSSYGLAAVVAGLAGFAGAGVWVSLLVFWLGGAMTVFAVGMIAMAREPNNIRTDKAWTKVAAPSIAF